MAKHKHKRQQPALGADAILAELADRTAELATVEPGAAGPLWGAVHKLLLKSPASPADAARVITTRDVAALDRLLRELRGEAVAPVEEAPEAPTIDVPADEKKKAMRAFRKRLKLTRLDHESKLGVGPMTGGKKAAFDGIMPPREFPAEVWAALVADGKLRALGQGFYMPTHETDED